MLDILPALKNRACGLALVMARVSEMSSYLHRAMTVKQGAARSYRRGGRGVVGTTCGSASCGVASCGVTASWSAAATYMA
jgi:hypothetical protein